MNNRPEPGSSCPVALPRESNRATERASKATSKATSEQPVSLKALALKVLERNRLSNQRATESENTSNSGATFRCSKLPKFVTSLPDDWDTATPEEREAFTHLVAIRKMRESGEKPPEYTQASTCEQCGPVWLWKGAPERVQACVWCFNRVKGVHIPRPERIACERCEHFQPNPYTPEVGMGGCGKGRPGNFAREQHHCPAYKVRH